MSPRIHPWATRARRGAVAAGLLGAACGAPCVTTASAVPVSATLVYSCNFPLLVPQPLTLRITSDIPATIATKVRTPAFAINASADVSAGAAQGLVALGAVSIDGTAVADATITVPGADPLDLAVPTVVPKTAVPATGGFTTPATGETPPLTFRTAGKATINVGNVVLTLSPRLADGTLTGLDTFETECFQKPGQNNVLATINITDTTGTTPPVTTPPVTTPPVTTPPVTTPPKTTPPVTTPPATTPGPGTVSHSYAIAGSATLKTLVKGSLPLSGSIATQLAATGAFTGDLALNQTSAKLTALGFLPVSATVAMIPTDKVTGTLASGVLNANAKIRIKLPSIKAFGIQLAGGANCQATQISSIALKSTDKAFDPAVGGTIGGTFSISNLSGCGALTGIISPLTAGGGNAIALKLTPTPSA